MPPPPSFAVQTQKNTWGGFQSATFYSGAVAPSLLSAPLAFATGSDVMLVSGGGRLDSITVLENTAQSGLCQAIVFYDAALPVSGGPIPASGHKVVGFVPPFITPVSGSYLSSGQVPIFNNFGTPIQVGQPFQSGLCFNSRSGQCGFSVTWTPETARQ